ncbi:MAG: hypothetical protein HY319_25990 [Armatimonadetes bacterium]|nr:hypothetical protein [Armatimonadota bacterium]
MQAFWIVIDQGSLILGAAALGLLGLRAFRLLPRWLSVSVLAAGLVSGLTLSTDPGGLPPIYPRPAARPAEAAAEPAADPAERVVREFHRQLNAGNCSGAYALLHSDWQYELSFRTFADGYAGTRCVALEVKDVRLVTQDRRLVDTRLAILEQGLRRDYDACYELVAAGGGWRLAACRLTVR